MSDTDPKYLDKVAALSNGSIEQTTLDKICINTDSKLFFFVFVGLSNLVKKGIKP